MAKVKLSPTLPDDDSTYNGLDALMGALLEDPASRHLVVGVVDNAKTEVDHRKSGARKPTAGIVHIEAVPDRYRDTVTRILVTAHRERVDNPTEPLFQMSPVGHDFDNGDASDPLTDSDPGQAPDLNTY
jgi:hypothetical protein